MLARATRVDAHAGSYAEQQALVFHPDDPLFAEFRAELEAEQGSASRPHPPRPISALTPESIHWRDEDPGGITPLESNALGLRYAMLRPHPKSASSLAADAAPAGSITDAIPSLTKRALRQQLATAVAVQAVEDDADLRALRGGNLAHRYNAVLKRVLGKGRTEMTMAELEAALAWLERNRLADHLHVLEGDTRYACLARQRGAHWLPQHMAHSAKGRP